MTARRSEENLQEVPLAVSAFSARAIEDQQIRNVDDISRKTPSLHTYPASTDPTGLFLNIRGQGQPDVQLTTDSAVGVYVDGVYLPRQFGLSAALFDVERIEVLKGPQGTLFGRNTTGGAISITTSQPRFDVTQGSVAATLGNYDRRDFAGVLNVPILEGKAAARLVVQRTKRDGYGRDVNGAEMSRDDTFALRGTLRFEPSDAFSLTLRGDYNRIQGNGIATHLVALGPFPATGGFASTLDAVARQSSLFLPGTSTPDRAAAFRLLSGFVGGPNRYYDSTSGYAQEADYEGYGVSAAWSLALPANLELRSITAHRWFDRTANLDFDATPFRIIETNNYLKADTFSQELQVVSDQQARFRWIAGAYYSDESGGSTSVQAQLVPNAANPIVRVGLVENRAWAAFGQATYELTDTLRITGGLRWNKEKKELTALNYNALGCSIPVALRKGGACQATLKDSYSEPSYVLSLDWTPAENYLIYAKTSRGFKGGGQNRSGVNAESFQPFDPEFVTDYEVGAKIEPSRQLRVNGALFYSDYTDAQRSVTTAIGGVVQTIITNAAAARIYGGELEVTAVPTDGLVLSASVGHTHAEYKRFVDVTGDRTNEAFPNPKWTYTLSAVHTYPTTWGDLRTVLSYDWRGKVHYADATDLPNSPTTQKAYGLVGARATLTIDKYDLDVSVFAQNILDKKYFANAVGLASLGFDYVMIGEPRTYGVKIVKRFGGL